MEVRQVERYGKETWESTDLDVLRKTDCLCLHCKMLQPGTVSNCMMAEIMFRLCQRFGMAVGISRCAEFQPK